LDDAIAVLTHSPDETPDADQLAVLADVLARSGRTDEALAELARATEAHPTRADLEVLRARILELVDQPLDALNALDRAKALGAGGHDVQAVRGAAYKRVERLEEAVAAFASALEGAAELGAPEASAYARELESLADDLLDRGRQDAALAALEAARQAELLTPNGIGLRAELLRLRKQWSAALEQALAARAAGATSVWLLGTMAQVLVALSRSEEALDVLAEAMERSADYAFGRSVQIAALDEVGRVSQALDLLDRHFPAREPPQNWEVWAQMARAQLLTDAGEYEDALRCLETGVDDFTAPDLRGTRGSLLSRVGDPVGAAEELRAVDAALLGNVEEWVLLELADALALKRGIGDAEAQKYYRRLLSDPVREVTPRLTAQRAWATFRLGARDPDVDAVAMASDLYRRAFDAASDPLFDERFRYVAVLCCRAATRPAEAAAAGASTAEAQAANVKAAAGAIAETDALFDQVAQLDDRRRAVGILRAAQHVCALLHTESGSSGVGAVEALSSRLAAALEELHGAPAPKDTKPKEM
jgi:tetratricopeptide (TPR) repeat protein